MKRKIGSTCIRASIAIALRLVFTGCGAGHCLRVAAFIAAAHGLGLKTIVDRAHNTQEWVSFASFGFDAIYVDDVPMRVSRQPRIE